MTVVIYLLLGFLVACALAVALTKDLLSCVLIQMGFSTVMAAAVGAGVTGVLFFSALRRIGVIGRKAGERK